jgi:hypothetical protein
MPEKPKRHFKIRFTERIYRLHMGGIMNHAPRGAGVFELVEFKPGAEDGTVIYVGQVPQGGSIAEFLEAIVGKSGGGLTDEQLAAVHERMAHLYFDAVLVADCADDADWQDLAYAICATKKPLLNPLASQPHSGRYSDITYEELPNAGA